MNAQPAKAFSQSLTIRTNAVFAAIGVFLMSLPDLLAQMIAVLSTAEVEHLLAILPPEAKEYVQLTIRLLGLLITFAAALNGVIRVGKTKGPVAPPKIGGGNA